MKHRVWYMKPEWFAHGITGGIPNPAEIEKTHVYLREVDVSDRMPIISALEHVFHNSQGEVWSPRGEARPLIESKGLKHTSMSVGDVIEFEGRFWLVASVGFKELRG